MLKRNFKLCWYPCSMRVHSYPQKYLETSEFAKSRRFFIGVMNATTLFHYIFAFNVQYQPKETGLKYSCSVLLCIGSG